MNRGTMHQIVKCLVLFCIGAVAYAGVEILWRGYTHWTMAALGGVLFLLIGGINNWLPWDMPLWLQAIIGSLLVTGAELMAGIVLNIWLAILSAICILWLLPMLVKRGVNVSGVIAKADMAISAMDTLTNTVKTLFPETPGIDLVDKILTYAQKAADSAEQLYLTSQIPEEQRKKEAIQLVCKCLQAAGITITEDMQTIIDGAIEAAVYALPKTHTEQNKSSELFDCLDDREESGLLTE